MKTFRHTTIIHRTLGISVTPKVHLLETHASEFLEMMGGEHGLGYYSELAMESMHKELKKEWQGEKLAEDHPNYGEKLCRTIVRVNGKHL